MKRNEVTYYTINNRYQGFGSELVTTSHFSEHGYCIGERYRVWFLDNNWHRKDCAGFKGLVVGLF
jgi:hypothetical protein